MTRRKRRQQEMSIVGTVNFRLPKRRRADEDGESFKIDKIEKEDALNNIQLVFISRLEDAIQSFVKAEANTKKKKPLTRDEFDQKVDELESKLMAGSHAPRGIFEEADKIGHHPSGTSQASIGRGHNIRTIWNTYVEENLPAKVDSAWLVYQDLAGQQTIVAPKLPVAGRIRSCRTLYKHVKRQDLPPEHALLFPERLRETAIKMTNLKSDLAAIIQAIMLDISQKGFSVEGSSVQPNDTAPTKGVDINRILPAGMIRNKACLSEEMFIPVATLPEDLSGIPKDADFYKLFSDDHIQHIWHKNMSRVYQSSRVDRHPLWTSMHVNLPFSIPELPGLSGTANSAAVEVARSIKSIWKASLFAYQLKRLLLLYFRGRLAPDREERHFLMRQRMSKQADIAKKEKQINVSRKRLWQVLRRESKSNAKCIRRVDTTDNSAIKAKWLRRKQLSDSRIQNISDKLAYSKDQAASRKHTNDESYIDSDESEDEND